ncbi:MAG: hypothetical protein QOJ97_1656 [Solirubrobacteraceae bacterium]|jgi:hypothetical protein|nr:hypothetical protein [Solirubrobacteraceae bacterium]
MAQEGFQQALAKLVNDASFRSQVENDPSVLKSEFSLDDGELQVLSSVGQAAGGAGAANDVNCCCCCV